MKSRPLLLLLAILPARAVAQSQPIIVPAATGFRVRSISQHQLRFQVAVDTAAGGLVVRNLAIDAFMFAASLRVDGVAPFARAPEPARYADSARFESDGRVVLAVADRESRGPIAVEPRGVAGSNAGRVLFSAVGWPPNRVLIVTIDPLDLYVTASRRGFGSRDRVRVDDTRGVAFISDSAASPAVVAIGMGRGARGRLQSGASEVLLERDYGGETGRERRAVNRLVLFIEPDRSDDGVMRAELVIGLGRSEAEAYAAAQAGALAVPAPRSLPRITTPAAEVALALAHLAGAAAWNPAAPAATAESLGTGAELWRRVSEEARQFVQRDYGRPDSLARDAVRFERRVIAGLLGLERDDFTVTIAPRVGGAADDFTWRVDNFRLEGDSLSYAYRPADRRATVTVGAVRRVRLHFRFPWLTGQGCVTARSGRQPVESLPLVMMDDGSGFVDVRASFDPVTVTVTAAACG